MNINKILDNKTNNYKVPREWPHDQPGGTAASRQHFPILTTVAWEGVSLLTRILGWRSRLVLLHQLTLIFYLLRRRHRRQQGQQPTTEEALLLLYSSCFISLSSCFFSTLATNAPPSPSPIPRFPAGQANLIKFKTTVI